MKWVKENDLAHGEYDAWLETINTSRSQAHKFIKVADEFSNVPTSAHLGMNILYEIATMPESERDQPQQLDSGEVKKPASSGGIWQRTPKRFGDYWGSA